MCIRDSFRHPLLTEIGKKYGKSAGQTALRFLIQIGTVVIPKSTHIERMKENFDVFDFALSDEDISRIRELDGGKSIFIDHQDPETAKWFTSMG